MANENIRVGADMTSFDQSMEQSAKKAEQSFYDIVNSVKKSSSNVKKELREVQNAMTSMLANGVSPASAEYQKLAQRAGELKDAIGDVAEEINAQANDTRNMTLALGALGDGLTAFQAGQAAMSAFGLESEDAAKAIQKMMAAQQLLNSVQALGNSITSKSTLLGKAYIAVKGLLTTGAGAQAVAEGAAATATTGLAAAEGGATVATTVLTAAINALPFVAAAGAAVMFVGIMSELVSNAKETAHELELLRATTEAVKEANGEGAKSYMGARLELDKYVHQITNFVGTAKDEKDLVEELNKKYGDQMGHYKTLRDWKNTLISQSDSYCKMLAEEAKAQALSAKMGELYAKQVTGEISFKDYTTQVNALRSAWENALDGVQLYKTILKTTPRVNEVVGDGNKSSGKSGGKSGGKKTTNITETLHTMEQVDSLISSLWQKINAEGDLAKKLDLTNQLKQVEGFKKSLEDVMVRKSPVSVSASDLAGLPKKQDLSKELADLGEVLDKFNEEQMQRMMDLQQSLADFKDSLSGSMGSVVEDFSMLAKLFQDGNISATDAAAGLVVLGDALKQMGSNGPIAKAGAVLAAIGQIILGFAQASAQAASLGPWGWLAFVGAGLGAVAATISTIQGFNRGGIVRGAGSGDSVPAMLTPGEAVLTRNDQARLWRLLKSGGSMGGAMPEVRLRIQGGDLVGVMGNYGTMTGKI